MQGDEVILKVEDKSIQASRIILSAASPVFKTMLESSFLEGSSQKITLPGKSYEAVKFVVNYVSSQALMQITGITNIDIQNQFLESEFFYYQQGAGAFGNAN